MLTQINTRHVRKRSKIRAVVMFVMYGVLAFFIGAMLLGAARMAMGESSPCYYGANCHDKGGYEDDHAGHHDDNFNDCTGHRCE